MIHISGFVLWLAVAQGGVFPGQDPFFAPAPTSPLRVGEGAGTVLLQDITRDGRLDLLTRHLLTRRVVVMRGDGRGGFSPAGPPLTFDYEPADIELGDVNLDGILDLVVTASTRDIVDVMLGDGRGGFRPVSGSPFTVSRIIDTYNKRTLHLVDINGDGNLDIATANGRLRNTVHSLLGTGRGGFQPGPVITLDTRGDGFALVFGDLNEDGRLDAVSASSGTDSSGGRLAVQLGDGRGGFLPVDRAALKIPPGPASLTLADMNGDRRLDIVIGHRDQLVSVFLNRGAGTFEAAGWSPLEVGTPVFAIAAGNVNQDERPDLVLATGKAVMVLFGGVSGMTAAPGSPFPAGSGTYNLSLADVNGDGRTDIAATDFEGDGLTILLGRR